MSTVLEAERLFKNNQNAQAENVLMGIISQAADTKDDAILREKELALIRLGQYYRDSKNPEGLASAIRSCRSFMSAIAKAKTAKLVKTLIDFYSQAPLNQHPSSSETQIIITRENVEWARAEKRVFLRQNLEIKLCSLLFEYQQTKEALALIANLLKELKKLDDKMILTEVHLLESRIRHALSDPPKAKAALISARTAANSIYCPPSLQAQLDMQSGVLHAEEKDYKTAYSYFFEALEGLATQDDPRASLALKCMLMCKVMLNLPEDVSSIQGSKLARKYAGRGTEAMQAIAKAHENRSLADFEEALKVYKAELSDDPIVRNHLAALYDTLLEQNLIRIIEPYSRIELSYVAEQVKLPLRDVEAKLSQMILDKVFAGILDQGEGCLEVFEEVKNEKMYDYSLETFKQIGSVVESLYAKAQKLGRNKPMFQSSFPKTYVWKYAALAFKDGYTACSVKPIDHFQEDPNLIPNHQSPVGDLLHKYFGQLELLELRFLEVRVTFLWKGTFTGREISQLPLAYEEASVIFNISAALFSLAALQHRASTEEIHQTFHNFRCAVCMFTLYQ
ncbi:hypothetical protein PCANC_07990 [Puccinia coronata f. sp. avenae]|uniref:PCI domain-containing protein n=1 Tax=Puccinia coronata f. sp. avenae TaxID=200324 RepID=A0A2N5SWB4_9BASI|nr:hypothetical protein PCANC_07990 [Puccinia coronata f. sp. avenae]